MSSSETCHPGSGWSFEEQIGLAWVAGRLANPWGNQDHPRPLSSHLLDRWHSTWAKSVKERHSIEIP